MLSGREGGTRKNAHSRCFSGRRPSRGSTEYSRAMMRCKSSCSSLSSLTSTLSIWDHLFPRLKKDSLTGSSSCLETIWQSMGQAPKKSFSPENRFSEYRVHFHLFNLLKLLCWTWPTSHHLFALMLLVWFCRRREGNASSLDSEEHRVLMELWRPASTHFLEASTDLQTCTVDIWLESLYQELKHTLSLCLLILKRMWKARRFSTEWICWRRPSRLDRNLVGPIPTWASSMLSLHGQSLILKPSRLWLILTLLSILEFETSSSSLSF